MEKNRIKECLEKYGITNELINKLLDHITFLKEHIQIVNSPKQIGDSINLDISLNYVFDGVIKKVYFWQDHEANSMKWVWDFADASDKGPEDSLEYIFVDSVCGYISDCYDFR